MFDMDQLLPGAEHFYVHEFACRCGCGFGRHSGDVSQFILELLENVRRDVGGPLHVTSGCRCKDHNRAVRGVEGSVHTICEAADVRADGGRRKHEIQKSAYAHGATGVGVGEDYIHVDTHDGSEKYRPSAWGYV